MSQHLTLYRPGDKTHISRLGRLLPGENEQRLQQSLWGEDGHQKTVEIGIRYLENSSASEQIRVCHEENTVILEVRDNTTLYQKLEEQLAEAQIYRTFTRHSIVRFLVQTGFQLDYTC
jgi:hypothetical protein